jgi:hypothetical protein
VAKKEVHWAGTILKVYSNKTHITQFLLQEINLTLTIQNLKDYLKASKTMSKHHLLMMIWLEEVVQTIILEDQSIMSEVRDKNNQNQH